MPIGIAAVNCVKELPIAGESANQINCSELYHVKHFVHLALQHPSSLAVLSIVDNCLIDIYDSIASMQSTYILRRCKLPLQFATQLIMDRHNWLQHPITALLDSAQILPYVSPAHTQLTIASKHLLQVPKSDGAL